MTSKDRTEAPTTPWYKKPWIWGIIGAMILVGTIGNAVNPRPDAEKPAAPPAAGTDMPSPTTEDSSPPDLSKRLTEAITSGGTTPSWWQPVTEVEDAGSYIRLHVQEKLTDKDRDLLARYTRNFADASDIALGMIVVRDLTGVDSNHPR